MHILSYVTSQIINIIEVFNVVLDKNLPPLCAAEATIFAPLTALFTILKHLKIVILFFHSLFYKLLFHNPNFSLALLILPGSGKGSGVAQSKVSMI